MTVCNLLEVPELRSSGFGYLPAALFAMSVKESPCVHDATLIAKGDYTQALSATRTSSQVAIQLRTMDYKAARRFNVLTLEAEYGSLEAIAKASERTLGQAEEAVTASYLSQIKGGYRAMGDKVARKLERLRPELPPGWMDVARSSLSTQVNFSTNVETFREARSLLPLISWVVAGTRAEANDPYPPGAAEAWIEFDTYMSKAAYCLRVRGTSMVRPDGTGFPEGCLIAIEPNRVAKSGDYVIVRFENDNEATFKQYFKEGDLHYLRPLNPTFPTQLMPPDGRVVGVVREWRIIGKLP